MEKIILVNILFKEIGQTKKKYIYTMILFSFEAVPT